ncbi:MAG: choice-of-anchor Q domain-containing protein, partial [Acidobacteriota bacterium]
MGACFLTGNTVSGNSADSGGGARLYLLSDVERADLHNNIVWNNGAPAGADLELENDGDGNGIPSPVALFFNDFDQGPVGYLVTIPFPIDPSNLDNTDPLFRDPGGDDYRLQASSPLIDKGDDGAPHRPALDHDGKARLMDATVDPGAYENPGH